MNNLMDLNSMEAENERNHAPRDCEKPRHRLLHSVTRSARRVFSASQQALLPTWLLPSPLEHSRNSGSIRPTAYMNGLRGLVAVLVFVRHFSLPWHQHLDYGYGYEGYNGFLRLPVFRLLFSGPLVPIFFIVSGYVLSAKSLKMSRRHDWEPLLLALSSTVFRRGIRLFLPPLISTFFVMLLAQAGRFSFPYADMPGRRPVHPTRCDTLISQAIRWFFFATSELINPWRWSIPPLEYGPHLWTLPVSFKGSMVVFLTCLTLVRVKPALRVPFLTVEICYALSQARWDMAPFLAGMVLCELDLQRQERPSTTSQSSTLASLLRSFRLVRLLAGLYIGSFPRSNHHGVCASGYQAFCNITPNYRYWHNIGAFLILESVGGQQDWHWPLNLPMMRYFGKISFSMYIIHEPLLHVFGFFTVPFFWSVTGNNTGIQSEAGVLLAMALTGVVLVWLADLFHRHVEERCGQVAVWLERSCFSAA